MVPLILIEIALHKLCSTVINSAMRLLLWLGCWFFALTRCAGHDDKVASLTQLSNESPDFIVPITHGNLSMFAGSREYWTLVVITSTRMQDNCAVCNDFVPVLQETGNRWSQEYGHLGLLFIANIDLQIESNRFLFAHLNITNVPHIGLLPPLREAPKIGNQLGWEVLDDPVIGIDISMALHSGKADAVALAIQQNLGVIFSMQDQSELSKFVKAFSATLLAIMLIKKKGPNFLRTRSRRTMTASLFIGLILVWVSGFQWILGNGPPFVATNDKGNMIIISGGTSYQFGIETVLMSVLYAMLATSTVLLVTLGQYKCTPHSILRSEKSRDTCAVVNVAFLFLLYAALTCIAKRKDHDYPFVPWHLF